MLISLDYATGRLLSGSELSWSASGAARAGSITLREASHRRLLRFLLSANPSAVAEGAESLFDGIIAAWQDVDSDPAPNASQPTENLSAGPWRLYRLETRNFGGLNTFEGPPFVLQISSDDWCLEGPNGSGKTSLASAIVWALTGHRLREHSGLDPNGGAREPVYDNVGRKVGRWPPLVTYPTKANDLVRTATVQVRLTFRNPSGDEAIAERTLVSPSEGDAEIVSDIDSRLTSAPQLLETGLLMPARLAHIGFGSKSASLYEAMKMLTGLDQLADIALGAAAFSNKGRRFLKYAKDNGVAQLGTNFASNIGKARELAKDSDMDIPEDLVLGDDNIPNRLQAISEDASTKAGKLLALLKAEISDDVDLSTVDGRRRLSRAVNTARDVVEKKTNGVPLFAAWAALRKAYSDESFRSLSASLPDYEAKLHAALDWNAKQLADERLRLKALASRFFVPTEDLKMAEACPLCAQHLTTEDQRALAAELAALKVDAEAAERVIDHACSDIEKRIRALIPSPIAEHFTQLAAMNPAVDYAAAVRDRFVHATPFSDVLVGLATSVERQVSAQSDLLPDFHFQSFAPPSEAEPAAAKELRRLIHDVKRISALVDWWSEHRSVFVNAWLTLLGEQDGSGTWSVDSLEGMLTKLEEANDRAEPLDRIAKHLNDAKEAAAKYEEINSVQKMREDIATALEPLKELKNLVDAETHRSIQSLSGRVSEILKEIRLKDRFDFESTELEKRQVAVHGRFSDDYKIDATLVANASWIRSILWAFVFAMRDEVIEDQGGCSFPLVVLDDPQLTFDPKNKRKWAEKLVGMANAPATDPRGIQLFLVTHERQFFDILTGTCSLTGEKGLIARPHGVSGVTQILNGTKLERRFRDAQAAESDEEAYEYIRDVRVYCEDLLRIMLRPESYQFTNDALGGLTDLLKRYQKEHVAPFNRPIFKKLTNALSEQLCKPIKHMNATHHTNDGTIGLAEAEDVERYWSKTLQKCFADAFMLAADYDAYGGDSRLYAYPEPVIEFPPSQSGSIATASLLKTGIAAAATSDGLVGDGTIAIEEWECAEPLKLHNHDAYRVEASTLEPVATIGDVVLVKNYGVPNARNLVVAAYGDRFIARRLNLSDEQPGMAVLTGQATNPYALPEPVIAPIDKLPMRKIIGTLFLSSRAPAVSAAGEVSPLDDVALASTALDGSRLLKVAGRSMEPIALDGQYVITRMTTINEGTLRGSEGRLVIAIDENGAKYFKRLRRRDDLIILESANSDGSTSSELLSLSGSGYPKLTDLLAVAGVLFEEP